MGPVSRWLRANDRDGGGGRGLSGQDARTRPRWLSPRKPANGRVKTRHHMQAGSSGGLPRRRPCTQRRLGSRLTACRPRLLVSSRRTSSTRRRNLHTARTPWEAPRSHRRPGSGQRTSSTLDHEDRLMDRVPCLDTPGRGPAKRRTCPRWCPSQRCTGAPPRSCHCWCTVARRRSTSRRSRWWWSVSLTEQVIRTLCVPGWANMPAHPDLGGARSSAALQCSSCTQTCRTPVTDTVRGPGRRLPSPRCP